MNGRHWRALWLCCPAAAAVISYPAVNALRLAADPYHLTQVINKPSLLADTQTASRLHANASHSYYDEGLHLIRPQAYERNVGHTACWPRVVDDDDDDDT